MYGSAVDAGEIPERKDGDVEEDGKGKVSQRGKKDQ